MDWLEEGVPQGMLFMNCPGAGTYSMTCDIYWAPSPPGDSINMAYISILRSNLLMNLNHATSGPATGLNSDYIHTFYLAGKIDGACGLEMCIGINR